MSPRPGFPARLPLDGATKGATKVTTKGPALGQPLSPTAKVPAPATANRSAPTVSVRPQQASPAGLGLDSAAVRARMVQQIARTGVQDPLVLQAMGQVERHRFVESALVGQAYEDTSLPIGWGQTISKPNVVARMVELLRGGAQGRLGRVLEIGTGCGYQAAVLSQVATEVYSIERLKGLHERARENLRPFRLPNVHLLFGDGMQGYAAGAPYAGIISAAGGDQLPAAWLEQLAPGARLVAPTVTPAGHQALMVVEKTAAGLRHSVYEAVHFVPLKSGVA